MLRDEIAKQLMRHMRQSIDVLQRGYEIADEILALIEGERCVWTRTNDMLAPECLTRYLDGRWDTTEYPYCPGCGKRIEVKQGSKQ